MFSPPPPPLPIIGGTAGGGSVVDIPLVVADGVDPLASPEKYQKSNKLNKYVIISTFQIFFQTKYLENKTSLL